MATDVQMKLAQGILAWTPKLVSKPLTLVPFAVKAQLISQMLKLILSQQQQDDELAFLTAKHIGINIPDLALHFEVSFNNNHWQVMPYAQPQVTFTADAKHLILIAAGKEDPDTLFFQRKLNIEGDTELGLEVKNLLLSIEFDALPKPINLSISKLAQALCFLQQKSTPEF